MPASNLQNVVEAMDEPFPNLEYILIKSMTKGDAGLMLPKKFQAPQLNRLKLWGIVPPIGSLLLPTTSNMGLVALTLSDIPHLPRPKLSTRTAFTDAPTGEPDHHILFPTP